MTIQMILKIELLGLSLTLSGYDVFAETTPTTSKVSLRLEPVTLL